MHVIYDLWLMHLSRQKNFLLLISLAKNELNTYNNYSNISSSSYCIINWFRIRNKSLYLTTRRLTLSFRFNLLLVFLWPKEGWNINFLLHLTPIFHWKFKLSSYYQINVLSWISLWINYLISIKLLLFKVILELRYSTSSPRSKIR